MSADPFAKDRGTEVNDVSGGNIIKTFIYSGGNGAAMRLFAPKAGDGYREADQYTIPPYKADLSYFHPCYTLNAALDKCNRQNSEDMKLPGRCAACNDERQALMKCFTKTKYSHPVEHRRRISE